MDDALLEPRMSFLNLLDTQPALVNPSGIFMALLYTPARTM